MIRILAMIFACVCVAVVLAELAALGLMYERGLLTPHHLKEIQLVFSAKSAEDKPREPMESEEPPQVSLEDVALARAVKILELDKREAELGLLKGQASSRAASLSAEQDAFRAKRKAFEDELALLEEKVASAATEQARGVLLALPPQDAVLKLMQLSLDENVLILKGMPEKTIAKILKEFTGNAEQIDRGKRIFEAISRGEPTRGFLDRARKQFESGESRPAPSA